MQYENCRGSGGCCGEFVAIEVCHVSSDEGVDGVNNAVAPSITIPEATKSGDSCSFVLGMQLKFKDFAILVAATLVTSGLSIHSCTRIFWLDTWFA